MLVSRLLSLSMKYLMMKCKHRALEGRIYKSWCVHLTVVNSPYFQFVQQHQSDDIHPLTICGIQVCVCVCFRSSLWSSCGRFHPLAYIFIAGNGNDAQKWKDVAYMNKTTSVRVMKPRAACCYAHVDVQTEASSIIFNSNHRCYKT